MNLHPDAHAPLSPAERELLAELVRDMGPRVLAYVRRVYGMNQDAEEIAAETFCRAAANMHALRASERRDLYLLTVARNLCRDRFRRASSGRLPDAPLADQAAHDGDPAARLISEERVRALRTAVARLPVHLREIVVLRLCVNLRFEDIAALLGIPLGTALSRMHAALQCLRQILGPDYDA
jgi:RNA polymerase sigma-70 factor (ECF subfamily)